MDTHISGKNNAPSPLLHLASGSPQRKALLEQMGISFTALPQDIDETFRGANPAGEARRLAREKVESLLKTHPGVWALGADTFVTVRTVSGRETVGTKAFPGHHFLHPRLLGKPADRTEAGSMLRLLSGRTQSVITGLALAVPDGKIITKSVITSVRFAELTEAEIEWYLETGEWEGAAGAYRIQKKGGCLVESVNGSYSNVVGLPIRGLYGILLSQNYPMY